MSEKEKTGVEPVKKVHPLREHMITEIERISKERLEARTGVVLDIFAILTGRKLTSVDIKGETLILGEKLIVLKEPTMYSVLFWVVSTSSSPFDKDWTFGTSIATPRSIATEAFFKAVEKIFVGFKLQKYTQIYYCQECGQPINAEFGFAFLDPLNVKEANIRVFKEEEYPCKCRSHAPEEIIQNVIPRRPK